MCNIIFYSPPKNSFIFKEMIANLIDPISGENIPSYKNRVSCIFTKFDKIYIERMVGTK